ncbi:MULTISPECIES: hypothetical protein [unclassified Brevundimonas]|nr:MULTISPECIES: hypothetical protein [unclassified Brevundimonas]
MTASVPHLRHQAEQGMGWLKTDPASGADASNIGVIGVSYGG